MKQNRSLLAGAAALVLLQGCGEHRENHILVARCGAGELYVQEDVRIAQGLRGAWSSVAFKLYYLDRRRRRIDLPGSTLGNYRTLPLARLKTYGARRENDWQLYVAPTSLASDEYEMLATCLGTQMANIERKMAVPREPRSFQSPERAFPRIATIRYASLSDERHQYMCHPEGTLRVNEDGRVWLKRDTDVLMGFVIEGGKRVALNEDSLRYWAVGATERIEDPVSYLRGCKDPTGRTMFEDFDATTLENAALWSKVEDNSVHLIH